MTTTATAKSSSRDEFWDNVRTVVYALALAMGIRFAVAQPFRIPSGSMQPTLLVGDYIVVSKWSYGYSRFSVEPLNFGWPKGRLLAHGPERGDVIVFRPPREEDKDFVKRLIGLPGDRIQMINGALYINDKPVQREALGEQPFKEDDGQIINIPAFKETLPNGVAYTTFDRYSDYQFDNTPVYRVPEGHYFFMGDDRDNSADSRVMSGVGYVPYDHLVGKARFVFASFEPTTSLLRPWTLITDVRTDRFLKGVK